MTAFSDMAPCSLDEGDRCFTYVEIGDNISDWERAQKLDPEVITPFSRTLYTLIQLLTPWNEELGRPRMPQN
jgi:hypothetical protein